MISLFVLLCVIGIIISLVWFFSSKTSNSNQYHSDQSTSNESVSKHFTIDINFGKSDKTKGEVLVFDIETTGLPTSSRDKIGNFNNWPKVIQLAWILFDDEGKKISHNADYIKINESIPLRVIEIHGITDEKLKNEGRDAKEVFKEFLADLNNCHTVIGHNIEFDGKVLEVDLIRNGFKPSISKKKMVCTMLSSIDYCRIYNSNGRNNSYKYPKLEELYQHLFYPNEYGFSIRNKHDAIIDSAITAKCYFELIKNNIEFKTIQFKNYFYESEISNKDVLIPDFENAINKENPFFTKKVVVTGVFQNYSREELKEHLKKLGADVNTSISRVTDYVIAGENAGPAKLTKIDELQEKGSRVKLLSERDFLKMIGN